MAATTSGTDTLARQSGDDPIFWEPSLAFLKLAIAVVLAGAVTFEIAIVAFFPDPVRAVVDLLLVLVSATAWFLLARSRIRAAAWTLIIGVWTYCAMVSYFLGGVESTVIILFPLLILLAGWMIGTRVAAALALLTIAVTLGFVVVESQGLLPHAFNTSPSLRWIIQTCAFIFSAILIHKLVRSYRDRLQELRTLGAHLAQRTAEVLASEADLNRAQAVARVGSWVYDLKEDTMRLSAETCRIFGLSEGIPGTHHTYLARVHPDDRARVDRAWRAALDGGERFDDEHRILVGESTRWIRQLAELERGSDGRPLRSVGTTQDITERKRVEDALRESETRFRRMFESNASVMLLINPESLAIVDANAAAARFYGYPVDHLRTMRMNEINTLPPAELAAERDLMVRQERSYFIFRHRLASGEVRTVETRATPIDVDGKVLLFSIISDVTELKRAEDALQQRTRDLEARNEELTRFSQVAVDRELRMIELKREVNALCTQLGEPPHYSPPNNG